MPALILALLGMALMISPHSNQIGFPVGFWIMVLAFFYSIIF